MKLFTMSVVRPKARLSQTISPWPGLRFSACLRASKIDHNREPPIAALPFLFYLTLQILGHLGLEDGLRILLPSNSEPLDWTALAFPKSRSRLDQVSLHSISYEAYEDDGVRKVLACPTSSAFSAPHQLDFSSISPKIILILLKLNSKFQENGVYQHNDACFKRLQRHL